MMVVVTFTAERRAASAGGRPGRVARSVSGLPPASFFPGLAGLGRRCRAVLLGGPYVTDQLAMARLPRATFALMLALLPAAATLIGLVVLGQIPTVADLAGIGLVIGGVAVHHQPAAA